MPSGLPIPVKGFLETSFVDWPGKICAVIFFPRCNFRCGYCHNAPLVLAPETLATVDFDAILQYLESRREWIDGVCVTGGEPTLHECLPLVLAALRARGFATKLDTNGSNPGILEALLRDGLVDYVAMDIKASLDASSYCAVTRSPGTLAAVKKSIRLIIDSGIEHEFRCTVLPDFHDLDSIVSIARELNGAQRLRLQNFNPGETLDPAFADMRPYTDEMLTRLQEHVNDVLGAPPAAQCLRGFPGTA